MDDEKKSKPNVLEIPSDGILLDRSIKVSDDPHPIDAVLKKNNDCLEVMNGINQMTNVVSMPYGGGAFIFWMSLVGAAIGMPTPILVLILTILTVFVVIPLTLTRVLESNFRLNRKTHKLYAVDKNTFESISCDLDSVTIHKCQGFSLSGRGVASDYYLLFSGKDEATGKVFSFQTPTLSSEDHCISNWEYLRRFMQGTLIEDMSDRNAETILLGTSFAHQMKLRINFGLVNSCLRPMKLQLQRMFIDLKGFKVLTLLVDTLFLLFTFIRTIFNLIMLPGELLETWAYFYWKKHPKFSKENNELCGFDS